MNTKANWKDHVAALVHAYNYTKPHSTGYSPFYLMFGRNPRLSIHAVLGLKGFNDSSMVTSAYVEKLKLHARLEEAYRIASEASRSSAHRHKELYDGRIRRSILNVGGRVLVCNVFSSW